MNWTKAVVGAAMLLGAATCGAAQEQAARATGEPLALPAAEPKLAPAAPAVHRAVHGRQRPRLAVRLSIPPGQPVLPATEPRTRFGERHWSEREGPFDGLRERIRIEKFRNSFRRESWLALASVGPLQLAAFEAHQRGATLYPVTQYFAGRAADGGMQLINLSRPGSRSYGLCLALRWN